MKKMRINWSIRTGVLKAKGEFPNHIEPEKVFILANWHTIVSSWYGPGTTPDDDDDAAPSLISGAIF